MRLRGKKLLRTSLPAALLLLVSAATSPQQAAPGDTVAEPGVAEPVAVASVPTEQARSASSGESPLPQRKPHAGIQTDLFRRHQWYTPPPPRPAPQRATAPVRREPTAPPMPYKLLGIYEQDGSEPLYLLVKNDRIFEVSIGDTLEDTYTVDGVANGQLMLTYLPLNTSQGIRLGEQQ